MSSTDCHENQGGTVNIHKNSTKIVGLILGLLLTINTATASLLIEPHVGYNVSGSGDLNGVDYDYNGAQYGLKLGYQSFGLMAGFDFTRSSFDLDAKGGGVTVTTPYDRNEFGVFVGYNFPILVRAWGAYYFSNKMKNDAGNVEYSGNTKELGVGFTGLPFLSLNLIYRMVTYDELNSNKLGNDIDLHEFVLGVSLPLTL